MRIYNQECSTTRCMEAISEFKSKIRLSELLYYLFFVILFMTRTLGLVEGNAFYSIVLVIALFCFAMSYIMISESVSIHIIDAILLGVSVVSYTLSGEKGMILFFAMMIGARYVSIDRLFKIVLVLVGVGYATMLFLGIFGFIQDAERIILSSPLGDITRRSISNLQVNVVMTPYLVFMMMAEYIVRNADRIVFFKVTVLLLLGLVYIFSYCFAKTALIVGMLFLLLCCCYRLRCSFTKRSRLITYAFYLSCSIIGIAAPALFDISSLGSYSDLSTRYPRFLSWYHRLYIGKYYLLNNEVSIMGQRLYDPTPDAIVYPLIHQSQLYMLLQYGVVVFILVNALHLIAIEYYLKKNDGIALAILLSYAFIGISEPLLFNLSFKNISFVFIGVAYTELARNKIIAFEDKSVPGLIRDRVISISFPKILTIIGNIKHISQNEKQIILSRTVIVGICALTAMAFFALDNVNAGDLLFIDYARLLMSTFIWSSVLTWIIASLVFAYKKANQGYNEKPKR